MSQDDPDPSQLCFEDGQPVKGSDAKHRDEEAVTNPVEPGDKSGFVVDVKPGATDANSKLQQVVESRGNPLEFGSRSQAEDYARHLSESGGALRVQSTPENEPRDIDAYLLADHNPSIKEPAEINGDTWTFDIGANLYGTLGEAVLLHAPKPYALVYFVRQDLDIDEEDPEVRLKVDVKPGSSVSIDAGEEKMQWVPDCVVEARDGWNGRLLERYYCEIKTGDASFERSQVATMQKLAKYDRVLKIRVNINSLPNQYSLKIHEV